MMVNMRSIPTNTLSKKDGTCSENMDTNNERLVREDVTTQGDGESHLRADRLSLLHTLPHPQLDFMPQSSELQHTGDTRFK